MVLDDRDLRGEMKLSLRESVLLGLMVAGGAYLRFSHLDLLEFKSDEAFAAHLALQFVRGGELPTAGLMSSVGVTNPPLFIYLLIPMFLVTTNPAVVSCMIAALGLGAVVMCWHIGRKYYGPVAGLVAAALFAVSPWAVIYSRKIWAQDFVPVFATGLMWALHALVVGKKPKTIFWVALLPLCVVQIHFSGIALTAAVVAILLVLRPKMDWRFAVAGVAAAVVLAVPYLRQQSRNNWEEFRKFAEQRRARNWQIPKGMTIQPASGYPLPRRPSEAWIHALSIMNAGEIEDVLGLSAGADYDRQQIWAGKQRQYFSSDVDWVLWLQRLAVAAALVWLAVSAARSRGKDPAAILLLWVVVPVAVFMVAGLWTYLSYYAILYPAHFVVLGLAAETMARRPKPGGAIAGVVASVFVAANVVFMLSFYEFVRRHGGAQGTYGTGLGYKQTAARYLAERVDVRGLLGNQRLLQIDQISSQGLVASQPQLDLPFLALLHRSSPAGALPTNTTVVIVDASRTNFDPQRVVVGSVQTNFGPMRLYFVER
jgi:hypothetical protein